MILLPWFNYAVAAAQAPPAAVASGGDKQAQDIEEITVIGLRELTTLKTEMIRAEELKYRIFNSLNSTDEFDITCESRPRSGSHIAIRVCDVGYMKKARSEDVRKAIDFGWWWVIRSDRQLATEYADKTRTLNKEMLGLAAEHPELATAMIKANALQQRYIAERREKFKDSILIGHPKPDDNAVVLSELEAWYMAFLDHERRGITDEAWRNWDNWIRTMMKQESYRDLWAGTVREKYTAAFIRYIDVISHE